MQIKVIEKGGFLYRRDKFEEGDIRTVPDDLGAHFCLCGWAEDVAGKVKTAPRDIHRTVTLDVQGADHNHFSEVI